MGHRRGAAPEAASGSCTEQEDAEAARVETCHDPGDALLLHSCETKELPRSAQAPRDVPELHQEGQGSDGVGNSVGDAVDQSHALDICDWRL